MSKDSSKQSSDVAAASTAVIVAGGDRPAPSTVELLPTPAFVIAADSGVDHARSLGLEVDAVVGDLDSASSDGVEWARSTGAEIETHPTNKDKTDLELALSKAGRWAEDGHPGGGKGQNGATWAIAELVVLGLDGGRFDHWLANILTLAGPYGSSVPVTAYLGSCRATVTRDMRTLWGRPGELVTLLAIGGAAEGVTTAGLVYALDDERLEAASARGVSNLFEAAPSQSEAGGKQLVPPSEGEHQLGQDRGDLDRGVGGEYGGMVSATVTVKSGILLALQPYALSGPGSAHPPNPTPQDE